MLLGDMSGASGSLQRRTAPTAGTFSDEEYKTRAYNRSFRPKNAPQTSKDMALSAINVCPLTRPGTPGWNTGLRDMWGSI